MKQVGIRALKQNASAVVAAAAAGEPVTITDRGRPVAQLVPLPKGHLEALVNAGRARPATRRFADLGAPPRSSGAPLSELLATMRDGERH
jgi:prevent-host-death family protein